MLLKERARLFGRGLVALELGIWAAALLGAFAVSERFGVPPVSPPTAIGLMVSSGIAWIGASLATGLLRSHRTEPFLDEPRRLISGALGVIAAAALVLYLTEPGVDTRELLMLFGAFGAAGVLLLRVGLRIALRSARQRGYNYRTVLIVGDGPLAERVSDAITAHRAWGLHVKGFVAVDSQHKPSRTVIGELADLAGIVDANPVDEVLFAVETTPLDRIEAAFVVCEQAGVHTRMLLNFFPHQLSRMELDDLDGLPMLAFRTTAQNEADLFAKRVFDIAVSVAVLTAFAPMYAAIALAVRFSGPGPILFRQERVGLAGRTFEMLKFRSMVADAERMHAELAAKNEMSGPVFKIKDDPRITAVGRFIRRTSLDEFPQFWNVLRGEMSVVGPRPPLPSEVARYERWQRRRLSVKPGITGMWQVSGRNEIADFDTWAKLDLAYIDDWSLWLDLKIVALTIPVVLLGRGAR